MVFSKQMPKSAMVQIHKLNSSWSRLHYCTAFQTICKCFYQNFFNFFCFFINMSDKAHVAWLFINRRPKGSMDKCCKSFRKRESIFKQSIKSHNLYAIKLGNLSFAFSDTAIKDKLNFSSPFMLKQKQLSFPRESTLYRLVFFVNSTVGKTYQQKLLW